MPAVGCRDRATAAAAAGPTADPSAEAANEANDLAADVAAAADSGEGSWDLPAPGHAYQSASPGGEANCLPPAPVLTSARSFADAVGAAVVARARVAAEAGAPAALADAGDRGAMHAATEGTLFAGIDGLKVRFAREPSSSSDDYEVGTAAVPARAGTGHQADAHATAVHVLSGCIDRLKVRFAREPYPPRNDGGAGAAAGPAVAAALTDKGPAEAAPPHLTARQCKRFGIGVCAPSWVNLHQVPGTLSSDKGLRCVRQQRLLLSCYGQPFAVRKRCRWENMQRKLVGG